jgi:hypothetical protein
MFFKHFFSKNKFSALILTLAVLSFVIGFYLRENSAGGGPVDLDHEWNNYNLLKKNFLYFLTSDFESLRFPLYHYLNLKISSSYIFDKKDFVNFLFLYSFFLPILFYLSLKISFKDLPQYKINLLASIIFMSPYFRTSSFWGLQENLAYFFFFLTLISYNSSIKFVKKYFTIFLAFLSFYADQKFLIVPIVYSLLFFKFYKKLFENFFYNLGIILFNIFLIIPALYIFYKWGTLTGVQADKTGLKLGNFLVFFQIISFYIAPIIILQKNILKKIFKVFNARNVVFFLLYLVFYFFSQKYFLNDGVTLGGGWLYKIYILIKKDSLFFSNIFYFSINLICFFLLMLYLSITKLDLIKIVIFIYYILLCGFISMVFQEYFDPIFSLMLIFFLNRSFFINLNFVKLLLINFYYLFFLIVCIFFYTS